MIKKKGPIHSFLLLALLSLFALSACDEVGEEFEAKHDFIFNGRLVHLPSGGEHLGSFFAFEEAHAHGGIQGYNDADGFSFRLLEPAFVTISLQGFGSLDPFLEIYDEDGFFMTADDNGGVGSDALLVGELSAGFYSILAWSSPQGFSDGRYELDILIGGRSGQDLGEFRRGDGAEIFNQELLFEDDIHTYVFSLRSESFVDLILFARFGDIDPAFQLIDQTGEELLFLDPPAGLEPEVRDYLLPPGSYMLIVSNDLSAGEGAYDLILNTR